ncbi:MAG: ABC transporter permease [Burkholderiales bacterium]|nr:ABC transporter permease [Burkholderiales bacterium]
MPVFLGVSLIVFVLLRLAPGDPLSLLVPDGSSQAEVERIRHEWGLDRSVPVQYWEFLKKATLGDFGESYKYREPVSKLVLERLPATVELALLSLLISTMVAIPIGIVSAVRRNSALWDHGTMSLALLGTSMPPFWLGIMLIIVLGGQLNLLPVGGRLTYGIELTHITGLYLLDSILTLNWEAFSDACRHIIMPAFTMGVVMAAMAARITRSSMLDVLGQDYITTARIKGLPERTVILKHCLRNSLCTIVTILGIQLGTLLAGSIIIETVFSWPGVGSLLIQAIGYRDYRVVQFTVLLFAFIYILVNLLLDFVYTWIDPRVRI